jgi:hypothetical protein
MKSSGEWQFRIMPEFRISEGYWHPFSPPKPKIKFEIKGEMKIYNKRETEIWTNEGKFKERFEKRKPLTQKDLLEIFYLKYETIFKWLLVGVNKREAFWDIIKRDASRNMLDCYEIRLEEIVESFTGVTKKYWENQRGIAARKKRTMLFRSDIFKHRRTDNECYGWETFGNREGTFAKKVLYYVREEMLKKAGCRIEGEKWE